jgi:hypothetical protein
MIDNVVSNFWQTRFNYAGKESCEKYCCISMRLKLDLPLWKCLRCFTFPFIFRLLREPGEAVKRKELSQV